MSHNASERMFWFRGSAMAVGGIIAGPLHESISAQAASILPPTGGFANASADRFNYRNIIGFDRAASTISGQKVAHGKDTVAETLVTVVVEGLNILDVITADRVVARLTSRHAKEKKEPRHQPEILPFGSHFENLRIGGVPVEIRPYPELVCEGSHETLTKSSPDPSKRFPWIDSHGVRIGAPRLPPKVKSDKSRHDPNQVRMAPLFKMSQGGTTAPAGCTMHGEHGILIPGFGVVYFGEYLITPTSRRLTMLRIELGCPITGSIVCGYVDTNGHWDP